MLDDVEILGVVGHGDRKRALLHRSFGVEETQQHHGDAGSGGGAGQDRGADQGRDHTGVDGEAMPVKQQKEKVMSTFYIELSPEVAD